MSNVKGKCAGFSAIEILVVISIFSILAFLATQALLLSLRGTTKSEASRRVRENLDYSLSIIERHIHNALSVSCPSSTEVSYEDENGVASTFSCMDIDGSDGNDGYIASGSARLTTDQVDVTACAFACDPGGVGIPPSVSISVTAEDVVTRGVETAQVSTQTNILLRTY